MILSIYIKYVSKIMRPIARIAIMNLKLDFHAYILYANTLGGVRTCNNMIRMKNFGKLKFQPIIESLLKDYPQGDQHDSYHVTNAS